MTGSKNPAFPRIPRNSPFERSSRNVRRALAFRRNSPNSPQFLERWRKIPPNPRRFYMAGKWGNLVFRTEISRSQKRKEE